MNPMEHALHGKVALVTGAGKGIGRAIALGYARQGAAVCCAGRTRADLESLAAEIRGEGGRAIAVAVDVSDEDAVALIVQACTEAFGRLDVLVINAGVTAEGVSVEESEPRQWRRT